ncbi:MAG: hypothetical protein Q9162_002308 [Coniocarpon cinnabarinum]
MPLRKQYRKLSATPISSPVNPATKRLMHKKSYSSDHAYGLAAQDKDFGIGNVTVAVNEARPSTGVTSKFIENLSPTSSGPTAHPSGRQISPRVDMPDQSRGALFPHHEIHSSGRQYGQQRRYVAPPMVLIRVRNERYNIDRLLHRARTRKSAARMLGLSSHVQGRTMRVESRAEELLRKQGPEGLVLWEIAALGMASASTDTVSLLQ